MLEWPVENVQRSSDAQLSEAGSNLGHQSVARGGFVVAQPLQVDATLEPVVRLALRVT